MRTKRFTKPEGYFIEITHIRAVNTENGIEYWERESIDPGWEILPSRGMTLAEIYDPMGNLVAEATAVCSRKDNYSKRIGKDIAVGRALKELNLTARTILNA